MRRAGYALIVSAVFFCTAGLASGCRKPAKKSEHQVVEEALERLARVGFTAEFEQSLAVVQAVIEQTEDRRLAFRAILERTRALLDLLVVAIATGDEQHFQRLHSMLSMQLDGDPMAPRNFQLVAQSLLESFRVLEREAGSFPEVHDQAAAMAEFCVGLQGILFREKQGYFRGRDSVARHAELRYLDDFSAVRDLIHETLIRTDGPQKNWQNVILTVVGRVCPNPAAAYVSTVCQAESPLMAEEFCLTDFTEMSESRRKSGLAILTAGCKVQHEAGTSLTGLAAVRAFYDTSFDQLKTDEHLRAGLHDTLAPMASRRLEAYEALRVFFE